MTVFGIVVIMRALLVVLLIAAVYAKHEKYLGWKPYYIKPSSTEQAKAVGQLIDYFELDVLSHPIVNREGVALVKPEQQNDLSKALEELGVSFRFPSKDLKSLLDVDDERIEAAARKSAASRSTRMPFDNYQRVQVFYDYMDDLGSRFPDTVTVVNGGNSFEGRPIKYVKISTTNFQDESKPVIFIDGGIHAREWISPPTVAWAMHKLTEDVTEQDLLNNYDWILLPVVNPDGYEYTFTDERFWRKTRSTDQSDFSRICPGVDGNRNYGFAWNTVGTSDFACSDIYAGGSAFSEVETRVVRDLLQEYLHRMPLYITMHSFGSMILYPWGNDGSLSHNAFALHSVGVAMAEAIDGRALASWNNYIVGNSALVLNYAASGAAEDYAHSIGVPLAYTYELPGLGWGFDGFHLEPHFIEQVCRETWEGIIVGARRAGALTRN